MRLFSPPTLGKLLIATQADIPRLGIVATAGFRYSDQFAWEKPYNVDYPLDSIISYQHSFASFVKSPEHIVLVATDAYDPEECSKTEAIIPKESGWDPPVAGEDVIVGIVVWKLARGSNRSGKFQNDTGPYPSLPTELRRDSNPEHVRRTSEVAQMAEEKYFDGEMELERIVVHPAYWKHGHGGDLARWGMQLADIDEEPVGVLATSMGAGLFKHLGFKHIADEQVEGDDEDPKGMKLSAMRYVGRWKDQPKDEM